MTKTYKEHLEWPMYRLNAKGQEIETIFDVTVSIQPAEATVIRMDPDDSYEGSPAEVEILSIHQGKLNVPERDWEAYGFTDEEIEKVKAAALEIEGDDRSYDEDKERD